MAQININTAKVFKACNSLIEYVRNNQTIIKSTTGAVRDGNQGVKASAEIIKDMALCQMNLKHESTDMLIDRDDFQLLRDYL